MIAKYNKLIAVACLMVSGCFPALADHSLPPKLQTQIKDHLQQYMDSYGLVGYSLAILRNGELVYTNAEGLASVELQTPVTTDHLFPMFSVAKIFVLLSFTKLVEQGKVELDAPLDRYLANLPDTWSKVSVRQALSHQSGFPEYYLKDYELPDTPEKALAMVYQKPFLFETGSRSRYTQTNFLLIRSIAEKVSGRKMLDLIKADSVDKLKLKHTYFAGQYGVIPGRVASYLPGPDGGLVGNGGFDWPEYFLTSSAGVNSNTADLVTLWQAVLAGKIVSLDLLYKTWLPLTYTDGNTARFSNGWEYNEFGGFTAVGHGGGNKVGVRHYFHRDRPDDNVTVIYLGNGSKKAFYPGFPSSGIANMLLPGAQSPLDGLWEHMRLHVFGDDWKSVRAYYRDFRAGHKQIATEATLNNLGYNVLFELGAKAALPLFELNVQEHPGSANPYDSLGEAHLLLKNKQQALANYKRAYALDPNNENAKKIIDRLEAEAK